MIDLDLFSDITSDVAMATNFVAKLPREDVGVGVGIVECGLNCHTVFNNY